MISIYVCGPNGLKLALHHYTSDHGLPIYPPVLYIHGATFPCALSVGFKFDGRSWADDLADAGYDVWGLDFIGFGSSDRANDNQDSSMSGRFGNAVEQIEAAVQEIQKQTAAESISLIAHSWGTLPAGGFAASHPDLVDRLILFGPISRRDNPVTYTTMSPTRTITLQSQYDRFTADVPDGKAAVLSDAHFSEWGQAYLDTDYDSQTVSPPAVTVPSGPAADISAAWSGKFPYDPSQVHCPVLIVRGEWDSVVPDKDAAWLYDAFTNAADKQDIKLARATHLAHLESGRFRLHDATRAFLGAKSVDTAGANTQIAVIFEVEPAEGRKDEYLAIAAEMRPMLNEVDGFISVERFQSLTNPHRVLSLSFFEDEAAIARWRTLSAHRGAQTKGRDGVFADYRLRIASVVRDYGMFDRTQAPSDSRKAHAK